MFVFSGGGVCSPSVAELDVVLIEVLFEFGPFSGGQGPVFPGVPCRPAAGEVGLVVADDVLLKDGHLAVGGLYVQVSKEGGANVDRQAVVDEVGGEQAAEVVWVNRHPASSGCSTARASLSLPSSARNNPGLMTSVRCPIVRWNRNGCDSLVMLLYGSKRVARGTPCRFLVRRWMMVATTWNSSAVIGITRSRSVLDGATTTWATTSPLGRAYWRMLHWDSSRSSSLRSPVCRKVSTAARCQNAASSANITSCFRPVDSSSTPMLAWP